MVQEYNVRKELNFRIVWGFLYAEIKTETHPSQP